MKLTIKNLMILALALVMALSMCACGSNDHDDDDDDDDRKKPSNSVMLPQPEEVIPAETEPEATEPAVPTEEELEILDQFKQLSWELTWRSASAELEAAYAQLLAIDKSVIDKWAGTQYAPAEHNNAPICWDYDALLAGFVILEDVRLEQTSTKTDFVGNVSNWGSDVLWHYDAQGRVAQVENESSAFQMIHSNPSNLSGLRRFTFDENGFATEIRYGYDNYGTFQTNYLVKRTLNEDGQVLLETVTDTSGNSYDICYSYDDQGRLTEIAYDPGFYSYAYYYTYDAAGRMVHSEFVTYMVKYETDVVYSKDIMDYTYDENGLLVSGIRSQEDWEFEVDWIKHGSFDYEYFVSNEYAQTRTQDAYTFACDSQSRVTNIHIIPGDEQILAGYGAGSIGSEAQYAAIDYEIVYGSYYTFTYPAAE